MMSLTLVSQFSFEKNWSKITGFLWQKYGQKYKYPMYNNFRDAKT